MLLECIKSVQNLRNEPQENEIMWEHVIYDDGSSDGTREHFSTERYPNTRYIYSTENKGIPTAGNIAIETCRSQYIFELDSDDIIPQRVLSNFSNTLREYPNCEWIVTDFYRMGEGGVYIMGQDYFGWRFQNCNEILSSIFRGEHFIQHNVLYSKNLWGKVGKYDELCNMAEDLDLYVRFLLADKMPQYVPYISHFHRVHPGNVSHGVDMGIHKRDVVILYKKYQNMLIERGIICPFA